MPGQFNTPHPRRRIARLGQRIIHSDGVLVTVIAVAMTLSAFAVYQGTRAADTATDLLEQSRMVASASARQDGYLQTLVANDLDVLRSYCPAELEAGVARATLLTREPDLPKLVAGELLLGSLRPLLLGDRSATCGGESGGGYRLDRAAQGMQDFQKESQRSSVTEKRLDREAATFQRAEGFLMIAGLLFAVAVSAIIVLDRLGQRRYHPARLKSHAVQRWQHLLLGLATIALGVGVALLTVFSVDKLATVAVYLGLVCAPLAEWLWHRRHARAGVFAGAGRARWRTQWWAEVAGALALVAFTASAVGLTVVSIRERDSTARAIQQESFTLVMERAGQQQAVRALAQLTVLAQFDAETNSELQLAEARGTPVSETDIRQEDRDAMRGAIDEQFREAEQSLRNQTARDLRLGRKPVCAGPRTEEAQLPSVLLRSLDSNPDAAFQLIVAQQLPVESCEHLAALSRYDAGIWSVYQSTLTVALVVLGLAGFLLALASASERSRRSSRVLFLAGVTGTTLGIVLAMTPVPAVSLGTRVPKGADAQSFVNSIVRAEIDGCSSIGALDDAIAIFGEYGPAYLARAKARESCNPIYEWPMQSAEVAAHVTYQIRVDLQRALALGPDTPVTRGNLGWFEILEGIQSDDTALSRQGLYDTELALKQVLKEPPSAGQTVHVLRFNRALVLGGLGEKDQALTQYREAVRCLDSSSRCPGGGVLDPALVSHLRLGALADLELLKPSPTVDGYRLEIAGMTIDSQDFPHGTAEELAVYPQELQLEFGEGSVPQVPVAWYYRPDDRSTWAILSAPSAVTLDGGNYLGGPVSAGSVLPSGLYRADVYADGVPTSVFSAPYVADTSLVRKVSHPLGMSVIVPSAWEEWTYGVTEWHIGPDETTGITLRRMEGMQLDDIDTFLVEQLDQWAATVTDEPIVEEPDHWLFGLVDALTTQSPDQTIWQEAAFAPYGAHWGCGGTLFLMRVSSDSGSPSASELYNSIVLERPGLKLPDHGDVVVAKGVSLPVPAGWDAAVLPVGGAGALLTMSDCEYNANVIVSAEVFGGSFDEYHAANLTQLRDGLPGFTLESDMPISVRGADDARIILFTWLPEGWTEPIRQWQIYSQRGKTFLTTTISTVSPPGAYFESALETITSSLEMSDP